MTRRARRLESWNLCLCCLMAEFRVVGPSPKSLVYCPACRENRWDNKIPRKNKIVESRPITLAEGKRRGLDRREWHRTYDATETSVPLEQTP
jgi:hypothetical protein